MMSRHLSLVCTRLWSGTSYTYSLVFATHSLAYRLGYFDPPETQPYRQFDWSDVNTNTSQALALSAAEEGIVLLKNDGTLPLSPSVKKLALIGPWADATTQMQGNYAGIAPFLVSPRQAFANAGFEVAYAYGTNISPTDTSGFAAALAAAHGADAVVFAGGIDNSVETEMLDRVDIAWPGNQLELIAQLAQIGKPFIVLQMGGGQVDSSSLKSNDAVCPYVTTCVLRSPCCRSTPSSGAATPGKAAAPRSRTSSQARPRPPAACP